MTKKDISNWNFAQYKDVEITKESLDTFRTAHSWILPQTLALIGSTFPCKRNNEGKFSFRETLHALGSALQDRSLTFSNGSEIDPKTLTGMLKVLNATPRGNLLRTSQGKEPRYSAAVPLILSAFKEYRNIKYSDWDWSEPEKKHFVDADLVHVSTYFNQCIEYSREELLEFREEGSTVQTGAKAGTVRAPTAVTSLTGLSDPEFKGLPRLLKLMLTQCWVYHPSIRNQYMICDPNNLDNLPEPLISSDIIKEDAPMEQKELKFPWDL